MKTLTLITVLTTVSLVTCDTRSYAAPEDQELQASTYPSDQDPGYNAAGGTPICDEGLVLHVDGTCVVPQISRTVFLYDPPTLPQPTYVPPPVLPPPRIERNIMFLRLSQNGGPEPFIIPPPRQNNIVYVLNKVKNQERKVIEVTAPPPANPEVYFVDYKDGENPILPGGLDLKSALSSAISASGQVLGGADSSTVSQNIFIGESEPGFDPDFGLYEAPNGFSDRRSERSSSAIKERERNIMVSKLTPVSVKFGITSDLQHFTKSILI